MRFLLSLIFLTALPVRGQISELKDLLLAKVPETPQVKESENLFKMAKSDEWRRFIFNEPQIQYTSQDDHTSEVWGLTLPIAFPGKSIALHSLDKSKTLQLKNEFESRKIEQVKFFTQAFLDCATAQAMGKILSDSVRDLETLSSSLNLMYENGHSTQAERIGSELQLRQVKSDYRMNVEKIQINCNRLESIAESHLTPGQILPIPDDLPSEVIATLNEHSPDFLRNDASLEVAEQTYQTSGWNQLPDLNISVNKNRYLKPGASPSGDDTTTTYGISVTLPLFFPFYEAKESRRAKSQALADKSQALQLRNLAISDEADARKEFQRTKFRLDEIHKRDMNLAETLVESTFSAYKSGKLGFAELMNSRKTLSDLKTQELNLRIALINTRFRCLTTCESQAETEK